MVAVVQAGQEVENVSELATAWGVSLRTLQSRCRDAGVTAKACLDFVRCLRLVCDTRRAWAPRTELGGAGLDRRTVERLITIGGLDSAKRPSLAYFLEHQRFLRSAWLRNDIAAAFKHL